MRGINGLTESGGLHGDGTDWYEVKLSPDLAAELRAALPKSFVERVDWFPSDNRAPPWWPTQFPSDAQCYRKDQRYLILPDTGTRAWFMRVRT